jgi:hypothetical protein
MPSDAGCGMSGMGLVREASGLKSSLFHSSAVPWVLPALIKVPGMVS